MCKTGTDAAVIAIAVAYGIKDDNLIEVVATTVSQNYFDWLQSDKNTDGDNPITLKRMILSEFDKRGYRMV
jgi:hypothetical protein